MKTVGAVTIERNVFYLKFRLYHSWFNREFWYQPFNKSIQHVTFKINIISSWFVVWSYIHVAILSILLVCWRKKGFCTIWPYGRLPLTWRAINAEIRRIWEIPVRRFIGTIYTIDSGNKGFCIPDFGPLLHDRSQLSTVNYVQTYLPKLCKSSRVECNRKGCWKHGKQVNFKN